MIELYGDNTGNAFRVAIALEESSLLHRYCRVDLSRGEQLASVYLDLNATGRIPTIVDLGASEGAPLVLTQSNAIMLYIAEKSGALLPAEGAARAKALEWFFFFVTDVIAPAHQSFYLRRSLGGDVYEEAARLLDDRATSMYHHVDRRLANCRFIAGETFGLADIAGYTITTALNEQLPWRDLPNLRRWFETVRARPAVIRGMAAFR
jgi:GSH-dependent disulfide-bond oxidoreductase